ncbi:zinc-ribbon domain-containing protein, partial [Acidobacteriota bacterium]
MSIKKCPYCKAMIDDSAAYCSNCGTKLLFPEDEFIEEEIPGEKIIEEEIEEKKDPPKRKPGRPRKKKEEPVIVEDDEPAKTDKKEKEPVIKPKTKEISINDPSPDDLLKEPSVELDKPDEAAAEDIPLDEPLLDEDFIKDTEDNVDFLDEPSPETVDELSVLEVESDNELEEPKSVTEDFLDAIEETKNSKASGIEDSIYHIDIKGAQEDIPDANLTSSKPLPETPPERETGIIDI